MNEKYYRLVEVEENVTHGLMVDKSLSGETSQLSQSQKPIVILFADDSTLFFAVNLRNRLREFDENIPIELAWYLPENALAYRQLEQHLGHEKPARILDKNSLKDLLLDTNVRAVATSRIFGPVRDTMKALKTRISEDRPCLISFLGGLDFVPLEGIRRRRNCDVVYAFPKSYLSLFDRAYSGSALTTWQSARFGHPSVTRPTFETKNLRDRKDIYFFAQALSPKSKSSREHIVRCLIAMANRYPEKNFWIKLRHLKDENSAHLHVEKYDFETLLANFANVPKNLKLTACRMEEALENAALGITCTSTAALDTLSAGIPCMVLLDFPDNFLDPLAEPMRKLFQKSGLIVSQKQMLNLEVPQANADWIDEVFCPRDLGQDVVKAIKEFEARPHKWSL